MVATVETVLGPIKVGNLGRTLTHEHLALEFDKFYVPPPKPLENYFNNSTLNLKNIGFIKQYPYSSHYNVNFNDKDTLNAVINDINIYKKYGGGSIVENTSHGIKRNISLMRNVSQLTGVNIVVGSGYYVENTQDVLNLEQSEENLYNFMLKELIEGCLENRDVKPGFIGEVGSSWPITDFEKRVIRATAMVQEELKCPVSFHPGRNEAAPFEIMKIFLEAGGNAEKCIMSHLDRTLVKKEDLLEFVKVGCYCQFDLFGIECSYYQLDETTDMPSDAQRIDRINWIKHENGINKILMSHDIHTKHRLIDFGGHGFCHIFNNVLPKMRLKGFTPHEIDTITITNPANWLSPKV